MACGAAVVATPNKGAEEIIGQRACGILHKEEGFAEEIIELLKNEKKRKDLALEGLKRARDFPFETTVNTYIGLYQKMIEKFNGG